MFGIDADSVTVTVADTDCVVSTISDTEIICELGAVPAGVHNIIVTTQLYGEWLKWLVKIFILNRQRKRINFRNGHWFLC